MADEIIETEQDIQSVRADDADFIGSFKDSAQQKAYRDCLNESGEFDREKIRDLAGRYLSERRNISRLSEMPESAGKFKELYNEGGKRYGIK